MKDRHGRGLRGPLVLPGPLTPSGHPIALTRAQRFDRLVLAEVERVEALVGDVLSGVEFGVEDTPQVPEELRGQPVPLAALVPRSADTPPRIVLFRRPIELRADGRSELAGLVREILAEQVADLLGRDPDDLKEQ